VAAIPRENNGVVSRELDELLGLIENPATHATASKIGRFTVLAELGAGGMGVVYTAYDDDLDRKVAIKLVGAASASARSHVMIQREAQAMARLSHPNVVQVYEVGQHNGAVFVAMEFIDGQTLGAWCDGETRSWREVLEVYIQAGQGLAAAHAADLVHRDFKPANTMVGSDGRVCVLDFGLARRDEGEKTSDSGDPKVEDHPSRALERRLTRSGAWVGTPAYMAPEQFRGAATDSRTDQFAYCVALFEALYGFRPFEGSTVGALRKRVTQGQPTPAPKETAVPTFIADVLHQGLQRDPNDRFASMKHLLEALSRDPLARRRKWIVGGSVVVLLGATLWLGSTLAQPVNDQGNMAGVVLPADGSLLKAPGGEIFFVHRGQRRHVRNVDIFDRMGFDHRDLEPVAAEVIDALPLGLPVARYPEGTLVKATAPDTYVIEDGKRRHIPNAPTFNEMRLDWSAVVRVPDIELDLVPLGAPKPMLAPDS